MEKDGLVGRKNRQPTRVDQSRIGTGTRTTRGDNERTRPRPSPFLARFTDVSTLGLKPNSISLQAKSVGGRRYSKHQGKE